MKIVRLLVLLLALAVAARAEIAPEKRQEIDKLLRLSGMSKLMDQMKSQMLASFRQGMPQVPAEFWTKFESRLDMNQLIERLVPIYDKYYSVEDLKAVNAFYESPAGQRLLSTLPAVMQEGMLVGQQWGREMGEAALKEANAAAAPPPASQ